MSGLRILCVVVGLVSPAVAHGEEAEDMFPVFQAICLGSEGDPAQAETLATANGFECETIQDNWTACSSAKENAPYVRIQHASALTYGMHVCTTAGTSMFLPLFIREARAHGMVEISPALVGLSTFDDQEVNIYVEGGCDPAALSPGCRTISALGNPVKAGEFDGIFRLAIVPSPEV